MSQDSMSASTHVGTKIDRDKNFGCKLPNENVTLIMEDNCSDEEDPMEINKTGMKIGGEDDGDNPGSKSHNDTLEENLHMKITCSDKQNVLKINLDNKTDGLTDFSEKSTHNESVKLVGKINEDKAEKTSELKNETGQENLEMEVICLDDADPLKIDLNSIKNEQPNFSKGFSDKKSINFTNKIITIHKTGIDAETEISKDDEQLCIISNIERGILQEENDAGAIARPKDDAVITEISANKNDATSKIKVIVISEEQATEEICHQCCTMKNYAYKIEHQNFFIFLCSKACLISFKMSNKSILKGIKLDNIVSSGQNEIFVRKCSECLKSIQQSDEKVLNWETMDFCNEDCLSQYQRRMVSHCASCKKLVLISCLGKYCVRFSNDIRQFCSKTCLEKFKSGVTFCIYCLKEIADGAEEFLAPVGDKGELKNFCSQNCLDTYVQIGIGANNKLAKFAPKDVAQCFVCNNEKQVHVHFKQDCKGIYKRYKFCSSSCFVAFKLIEQIDPLQCNMCKIYFGNDNCTEYSVYYNDAVKNFCCKMCQNMYVFTFRKIVRCDWCKVQKYHFDMIKKKLNNGVVFLCSLNCLNLFQVSISGVSLTKKKCNYCSKFAQAQYHLTMSDATIRNFCSHDCVMLFKNKFSQKMLKEPGKKATIIKPVSARTPKKCSNRDDYMIAKDNTATLDDLKMSVNTNIESLAINNTAALPHTLNLLRTNNQQSLPQTDVSSNFQVLQKIFVRAPPLPSMKNAATSCKPISHTKGIFCRPRTSINETQTDAIEEKITYIPIPVPVYVPAPLPMCSTPVPIPIPFPLPLPVPVFIPITQHSATEIMEEINKIQMKVPVATYEANLLAIAETVAEETNVANIDSGREEENDFDVSAANEETVQTSKTFRDDIFHASMKVSTVLDEPAEDLEEVLTANTIAPSQNHYDFVEGLGETAVDPQSIHQLIKRNQNLPIKKRKRAIHKLREKNESAKRRHKLNSLVEIPIRPASQSFQSPETEKSDANMCLKNVFAVNVWKQWITEKNAELKNSTCDKKLLKNKILELTPYELNDSLCLFVKEFKKSDGSEYSPDTIYYVCLGIQHYLFENGRTDNIFTDSYYEKFTDCLNELAIKFFVLYNGSDRIVTRVVEEHLWESKQLGDHSPLVLLNTLMFFCTKDFNLTTVDEHLQLSFSRIMKLQKRIQKSRKLLLCYYPPETLDTKTGKKEVYEQQENRDNPSRCPIKLYDFYLSKCPEDIKMKHDIFYLKPERNCTIDSPIWYSVMSLERNVLEKMFYRIRMVKEINVALLSHN